MNKYLQSVLLTHDVYVFWYKRTPPDLGNNCAHRGPIYQTILQAWPGNTKRGTYHCTVDLLFDWFGISCVTTDNICFYLQNRLIQTSQRGGQWYSDTSPFSTPWRDRDYVMAGYVLVYSVERTWDRVTTRHFLINPRMGSIS